MMRALRNLGRLMAIARTLARFDALFPLDQLALGPVLRATIRLAALTALKTGAEGADGEGGSDRTRDTAGARLAQLDEARPQRLERLGQPGARSIAGPV